MMYPNYIIKSSIDDGESFNIFAYYENIKDAIDGLAYLLKYYPDEKYQLFECTLTRLE